MLSKMPDLIGCTGLNNKIPLKTNLIHVYGRSKKKKNVIEHNGAPFLDDILRRA